MIQSLANHTTITQYTAILAACVFLLYAIYTMYCDTSLVLPFVLSCFSGLCTCIGALIVINTTIPIADVHLAYTCGLAAGVMLYISIFDMLLPAFNDTITDNYINVVLFIFGNICLYCMIQCIPDQQLIQLINNSSKNTTKSNQNNEAQSFSDPDIEQNITLINVTSSNNNNNTTSASTHSTLSPRTLRTPTSRSNSTPVLNTITSEHTIAQPNQHTRTLRFGLITAIVLSIHNLPEGLSVFISTLDNKSAGLLITFAISIHNIAEGLVVAVPLYAATKNTLYTIYYTTLSGITEPFGM